MVCRQVIGRIRVHTFCTNQVEQHKEVLQRRDLSLTHRSLVDLCSQLLTYFGVGRLAVLVIEVNDCVIDGFLFLPIQGTNLLCTLEEHVLQIVCQTGVFCRFIHCTCANYYVTGNIRLVVVFPQHYSEAVV